MKNKKYLIRIVQENGDGGLFLTINTDKCRKQVVINRGLWCFEKIGNAARFLESVAQAWERSGSKPTRIYGTPNNIPMTGCSNWNKALARWQYCGEHFPDPKKYGY